MTLYEQLINLKYREGLSTYELVRRFPKQIHRVSEVALLDIPEETLKKVIREKNIFKRLVSLKKQFLVGVS